jgi:hypothetical protein
MESPSTDPSALKDTDLGEAARSTARQLKDKGREQAESTKSAAADQAEAVAGAIRTAAGELRGSNETLASYAEGLGRGISSAADHVRNRSVDQLLQDAQSLARRNPALFLLGSVGVGIALSRLMKAGVSHGR